MASQCKRQQCTIDRRGYRQELDSWRHKLIHCVGFESILEGLFGSELVEDLKLFKDSEPIAVSDWSFDENCLFCCFRRDKVKEHLIGLSNEGIQDTLKPLLVKDQTTISRLEKQAEEFLNAVLCRKDVPSFLDPHIPIVAREILQRMIRQFAAEYTSKASSPQDSYSDTQPSSDQSLPTPPSLSGAPPTSPAATLAAPANNQNPVLSKLLMADQDAPLDLTIKKHQSEPSEQEGVLDLSIKKNRYSSSLPVHSPCLSPASSTFKGECPDVRVTKAKDLQSTSTLEQFMAKLCPHHQRQIVDAIGFLQTEVKALTSSNTQQTNKSASGIQETTAKSCVATPDKSCSELRLPSQTTPKSEVQDMSLSLPSSCAMKKVPESAVSLKTSLTPGPALDLRSPGSGSTQAAATSNANPVDIENNRHSDHAPLKLKIMKTSNITAGRTLSCVLTASLSSESGTMEDRQGNLNSNRAEAHSARLSSSVKRHNQFSHTIQARQRESLGHTKDVQGRQFSVHATTPMDTPRTARKTIRGSTGHQARDSPCRPIVDPDLGRCDIVYIDKPITECFKERRHNMLPRRNARKSTRGHMYMDEIWELKTVRTLAGRGNCTHPMPELITLVTPKQILSKPEGVPPVDMPFVGACRETMSEQTSTEESDEMVIPGTGDMVEAAASEVDIIVETSQTDQCQSKGLSPPQSPIISPTENRETDMSTDPEQDATVDLGKTTGSEESVAQEPFEAEKETEPKPQEQESTEQMASETMAEPSENCSLEEAEPQVSPEKIESSGAADVEQESPPSPLNPVEEEKQEIERERLKDEQSQELQPETEIVCENFEETEESNTTVSAEEEMLKEQENTTSEAVERVMPVEMLEEDNDKYDVSSKTLDTLLKELPPWRRKKGTVIPLPKRLRQTEAVIVGYVNGRPISASDRSLRRRFSNSGTSPSKTLVKPSQNVPNKTSSGHTEATKLEKRASEPETPTKELEVAPLIPQVTEPTSDTPSSPVCRVLSRTKQYQKQKKDQEGLPVLSVPPSDSPQNTEPKRQLRSSSQKPAGTQVSLPPSNSLTSVSSPKQTATHAVPPLLPPPPPSLPVSSPPLIGSSPSAAPEPSQLSTVDETAVELSSEKPVEMTPEETPNSVVERVQPKQKLRSAKAGVQLTKDEREQPSIEASTLPENPVKTETQMRGKGVLRKEALTQKPNVASLERKSASGDDGTSSVAEKPTRMPLRSESCRAEMSLQPVTQSASLDNKKLALRSQRSSASSTSAAPVAGRHGDAASPSKTMSEKILKAQGKPPPFPVAPVVAHCSTLPIVIPRPEPLRQTNKFLKTLTGEENQQLLTNLNIKFDKMQKGWVQMDKEGQPTTKYKNKADRQAAIWKSKRRARKPKSSEHQRYSPVQMLFMKGFDLTSICRWFLESTETKSLVIVKKVNTRLPSETQLCFHSSSSTSGTSQGVFPSLQAERLKKHLKKFAIASPVKSNPRSQKLIAKALEQEANATKGKERKEVASSTQTLTKSAGGSMQRGEPQKVSGKSKNPASARILRKYSNIRGKMQVQQSDVRKDGAKRLKSNNLKRLSTAKSASKSNLKPHLKARKSSLPVAKQMKAKLEKRKKLAGKKAKKHLVQEKAVRAQSVRATVKKEQTKRGSPRLGSPKMSDSNLVEAPKMKADRKILEAHKEVEKSSVNKMHAEKESSQSTVAEIKGMENAVDAPQQSTDIKVQSPPDQVLTRSQRKMEAAAATALVPSTGSTSPASKKASNKQQTATQNASQKSIRKAEEATVTRKGALKPPAKRNQAAMLPRSATKRAQELFVSPAKRTRTSLSK